MKTTPKRGGFIALEAIIGIIILVLAFNYLKDKPLVQQYWNTFTDNMTRIQNGQPNDFQLAAPVMNFQINQSKGTLEFIP